MSAMLFKIKGSSERLDTTMTRSLPDEISKDWPIKENSAWQERSTPSTSKKPKEKRATIPMICVSMGMEDQQRFWTDESSRKWNALIIFSELECSSSFLVHGSMKTENSPYRNWPDWDEHHSPSSTSSLDLCPTKVFVDLIVWYLLSWPVDLFLSSSFFSNLNDLLRRFFANASWTRQIRRLIISFDRWTHPSNIFSLLFSRWVFLSLHLLIKLRLLLFLATLTHSLSKQWCLWR